MCMGGGLFWLLLCLLPTQHGDRSQPTLVQQEVLPEGRGGDMRVVPVVCTAP